MKTPTNSLPLALSATSAFTFSLTVSAILALSLAMSACGDAKQDGGASAASGAPGASAASGAAAADPLDVTIQPNMAANFKVAKVAREQVALVQEVSGRIEANERQVTRIGAGGANRDMQIGFRPGSWGRRDHGDAG